MPVLYYVRHGETDWNVAKRLQGHRDIALNARGRAQASHCGTVLRDLFAREGRNAESLAYASSPLVRARETMELLRAELGLDPHAYATDQRLTEISFGDWDGLTLPEIQALAPHALVERDRDKWGFMPPGGESYRDLTQRVGDWCAAVDRDTVVAAHGGVARALIAHLRVVPQDAATHTDITHGVVYMFAAGTMTRHE
jgi:broad specificity phosphatase PhoE